MTLKVRNTRIPRNEQAHVQRNHQNEQAHVQRLGMPGFPGMSKLMSRKPGMSKLMSSG
jgi:hypothetical protein